MALMPAIPLGRSRYERTDLPPLTLKNYLFEQAPTNLEDQVALVPRPRLKAFAVAGDGPVRGLYRKGGVLPAPYSGAIICMSGDELYRVTQTGLPGVGTATLIGTVEGPRRMSAEGDGNAVVLACGTKAYTTNGVSLSQISFPSSFNAYAVDVLNGYFLFCSDLGRFYWSAIGGTTVDALDYATAESQPDVLLSLKVAGDELWLFGRLSVEVWQPTGDADLPFQRIGGRIFGIGVTAPETVQKLNVGGVDTVCWLGTDRRVYRTSPNPQRISDPALEELLQRAEITLGNTDGLNPYATIDSWNGHDCYVLTVPGEGSFAYDLATGMWHERTSHGRTVFRASVSAVGPNAQPLIGDDEIGQIWEMTAAQVTDGDEPVVFESSGLIEVAGAPQRCLSVSLDVATGTTSDPLADPVIQMSWSDDLGETFTDARPASLGRQGERAGRVMWTRLGLLRRPGRVFRWRTTEPVTLRKAKFNESLR